MIGCQNIVRAVNNNKFFKCDCILVQKVDDDVHPYMLDVCPSFIIIIISPIFLLAPRALAHFLYLPEKMELDRMCFFFFLLFFLLFFRVCHIQCVQMGLSVCVLWWKLIFLSSVYLTTSLIWLVFPFFYKWNEKKGEVTHNTSLPIVKYRLNISWVGEVEIWWFWLHRLLWILQCWHEHLQTLDSREWSALLSRKLFHKKYYYNRIIKLVFVNLHWQLSRNWRTSSRIESLMTTTCFPIFSISDIKHRLA